MHLMDGAQVDAINKLHAQHCALVLLSIGQLASNTSPSAAPNLGQQV